MPTTRSSPLPVRLALAIVVVLGVGLRLLGIAFGLPYHHHWDEGWIADSAAGMLRRHDDVPASYQYGAPLMRLTELVFVVFQRLGDGVHPPTPVEAQTTLYLAARVATALVASTGTLAVYLAAKRSDPGAWTAVRRALAAALLYAVASELVLHARYAVTDACLAALTAWTLALTAQYLVTRRVAWGFASAVAAGVTAAFKAPGIVAALIPGFAALGLLVRASRLGKRRRGHAAVLLAIAPIVVATYVLLNPHVVDRTQDAVRDLVGRYRQTRDGGFSSAYIRDRGIDHLASVLGAIVTQFASRSAVVSVAVSAVAAWGIAGDVRRRRPLMMVAAGYAACLVLSGACSSRAFLYRNYIAVVPTMCLGFGAGAVRLSRARSRLLPGPLGRLALVLVGVGAVAALVGVPVADALETRRLRDDPRVLALQWVAAQGGVDADEGGTVVAATPAVLGKAVLGDYPELRDAVAPFARGIVTHEIRECPAAAGGPRYVIDASYRDTHKAPAADPWAEQWLFRECPGYEQWLRSGPTPARRTCARTPHGSAASRRSCCGGSTEARAQRRGRGGPVPARSRGSPRITVHGTGPRLPTTRNAVPARRSRPRRLKCCTWPGVLPRSRRYLPRIMFIARQSGSRGVLTMTARRATRATSASAARRVVEVLEHLAADDEVEARVLEGQRVDRRLRAAR